MAVGEYLSSIFSLSGKTIMMTGAGGGLGASIAKGMAAAGGEIILCDLFEDKLQDLNQEILAAGGKASVYQLDVTDLDAIDRTVERIIADFGKIDVLFNVAGINKREGILDVSPETYDKIMDVNLRGLYFVSQRVGKEMYKKKNGNVIHLASHTSAATVGGVSVYGATKSAVKSLTQSMAVEWARYGIRCNAIAPGHMHTPLTTPVWTDPVRSKYLRERISMERPGQPEDLVGLAILLASDASGYMTGQVYHVDGGCLAGGTPWPYDTKY